MEHGYVIMEHGYVEHGYMEHGYVEHGYVIMYLWFGINRSLPFVAQLK